MKLNTHIGDLTFIILGTVLFLLPGNLLSGQQPTDYPSGGEPFTPTLGNILVYIGGPVLMYLIYRWYKRRKTRNN